jgi:hypothetical protein
MGWGIISIGFESGLVSTLVFNLRRNEMKKLFVLLALVCCSVIPVAAFAGNAHPNLYLEIYSSSVGRCVHAVHPGPLPGEIQCYLAAKVEGSIAYVPIHIGKLDTPPLAAGWPLPCGPGGGFVGVSYGLNMTGYDVDVTALAATACTKFGLGPSIVPTAIVFSADDACHDWWDHPGYVTVQSLTENPVYFTIVANSEELAIKVINCQGGLDLGLVIAGGAQWGGSKTLVCGTDPTSVDLTTWGKIKGLYR